MKKTFSTFLPHVAVVLFCLLPAAGGIFFTSCTKETVVELWQRDTLRVTDTIVDADTLIVHDTICEDCGFGRLKNIPLLGYGQPEDRRVEARQHIEAVRQKLRQMGHPYDYNFLGAIYTIQEIALYYPDKYRLYANGRRLGIKKDFPTFNRENGFPDMPRYLTDTVTIYIGGGPNYEEGIDYAHLLRKEVLKGEDFDRQLYDSYAYIPVTSTLMPRGYNRTYTSIIEIPHSTAGLDTRIGWNCTIQFFDYVNACGNRTIEWPYNILSYEDAELLNDIGVELLRFTVEELKRRGKTIAFFGTSWGAYVMARYLLYYPIEDFAHVVLSGFNPNHDKEFLRKDRDAINEYLETGRIGLQQEIYEMCRWRMIPWLTKHDLSRMRMFIGDGDPIVGSPTAEEIRALTSAGATVIEQIGVRHDAFSWYWEEPLLPTDTVVNYKWEKNMRIHTKNGVQVVQKAGWQKVNTASSQQVPPPQKFDNLKFRARVIK